MDTIRFVVGSEPLGGDDDVTTIHPEVNGTLLRELAAVAELPAARAEGNPDLAGAYAGLNAVYDLLWPSRHFLGEPDLTWGAGGNDTVLLGCPCGEYGCWPLTARVDVGAMAVQWSDFRTGHRDWDLSGLGPFAFDRAQYEAALGSPIGAA
jgi:hypothetical protein